MNEVMILADLDNIAILTARVRDAVQLNAETPQPAEVVPPKPVPPPPAVKHGLANPPAFFSYVRAHPPLGPTLSEQEVAGCERILGACAAAAFPAAWAAYTLATAIHETAGKLTPITEYGKGHGKPYGKPGRNKGQVPYGRGDVQLTWDENYERLDADLGLNGRLIDNYELALDPAISARILVFGMEHGRFTANKTKSLRARLPEIATLKEFIAARPIVNGTDRAALIAGYALTVQTGLIKGGWQ